MIYYHAKRRNTGKQSCWNLALCKASRNMINIFQSQSTQHISGPVKKLEFPQMNIETAKISTAERRFGMQAGIHGRRKSPQTKKRTKYQTCAEQEQAASQYESIESGDASEPKLISVRANRLKPVPDASLCVRQDRADS